MGIMGQRGLVVLWLVGLVGLAGCGASAGHGLMVPVPSAYVAGANPLFPTNSYDAHIRNLLVSGKVAEALGYAKEQYGRVPAWLRSYAAAFDAAKRSAGQCQKVAKAIHGGMTRLGAKPEYVSLRSNWAYMGFKMPDGTEPTITRSGYHVIVRVEQMVYDAYTGPAGMRYADYMGRLLVRPSAKLEISVVSTP